MLNTNSYNVKVYFENKWVSLQSLKYHGQQGDGYFYLHEIRCHGNIVSLLPFKKVENNKYEFLLRNEVTPCWNSGAQQISSITGGVDENNSFLETALIELREEAGYTISENEIIPLGTCRGTKSSDTLYHLFSMDLTGKTQSPAVGDGSELETLANCTWENSIDKAVDPLVYVSYKRLMDFLNKDNNS